MAGHAVQHLNDTSKKKTSRLCKVCEQIGTSDVRWFFSAKSDARSGLGIYIHRSDLHSVKASALNGCRMCEFILSTVVNSDDARHESTLNGDIVQDCQLGIPTGKGLLSKRRLLERYGQRLSSSMAYDLPTTFVRDTHIEALHLLAKLCGIGRVILIGTTYSDLLPCNLRAVVLYPFPALDVKDIRTPFMAGQPFELATSVGMKDLVSMAVVLLMRSILR